MANSKPIFGYWTYRGLGHPIRYILAYTGVDYEERLYSYDPNSERSREFWFQEKPNMGFDFPNIPYWIDGDKRVTEAKAIAKCICRDYAPHLLGRNDTEKLRIDMVESWWWEFYFYGFVTMFHRYTDDLIAECKEKQAHNLGLLSDFFGDNKYSIGNEVTYMDFFFLEQFHQLQCYDSKCFDNFPNLRRVWNTISSLPAIQEYMNSPGFIFKPCFSPRAKILNQ